MLLENAANETAFLGHTPPTRQNPILNAWRAGDFKGAKKALVAYLRSLQQERLDRLSGRRA